jgi:UDP-glucose 4-epimerase
MDVTESIINPEKYYKNNFEGSLNLFKAIKEHQIKHVIFASSSSVYGESSGSGLKEEFILNPMSPYAIIKSDLEMMIADYAKAYAFNFINFRYFNVAGIDQQAGYQYAPNKSLSLIPLILKNLLNKESCLSIYGNDFKTSDKTAIRDYIHAKDLAFAHIMALEYLFSNKPSETLNLGSGKGTSILEVIKACERITGQKVAHKFCPARKGEIGVSISSMEKTYKILGFNPHHSDLLQIVKSMWNSLKFS